MVEFYEITIESKGIMDSYFRRAAYPNSEFNFTNMFMWRKEYNIRYAIIDDFLCIGGKWRGKSYVLFPIGSGDLHGVFLKLFQYFDSINQSFCMKAVLHEMREQIEMVLPDTFSYTDMRWQYDYVYRSEDLIHLKGKKYHSKRNHINSFTAAHDFSYVPLTTAIIEECRDNFAVWLDSRESDTDAELHAINEIFDNYEQLNVRGCALRVNGDIVALSIGEELNKNTAIIHIEKASLEYSGAYPVINQLFCRNAWSEYEYINREEDMGIEGLRKAKLSYKPVLMVEKFQAEMR